MDLTMINLRLYLESSSEGEAKELCGEVSQSLRETGALLVKAPRCTVKDNDRFLDMMERYFDSLPEFKCLQVGVTPEGVEVPRSLVDEEMQEKLKKKNNQRILAIHSQGGISKMAIHVESRSSTLGDLLSEPVVLEGFPEWKDTMDSWGYKMISAVEGPHLLAPTGSDLRRFGREGTVFAGYHYDLNFPTIHGRSRFPGLNIWLRNGQKVEVKIEWLTAGDCLAGMHEVVVTNRTVDAIKLASEQNRLLWRVSSTLFAHMATDALLKPLGHFAKSPLASKYPTIYAGEFVEQELAAINLQGIKGEV